MTENELQSDEEVKTPLERDRWWLRCAFRVVTLNGLLVSVYNNLREKEMYVIMFLVSSLLLSLKDAINDHFDDEVIDPSGHEWKGNLIILSCFVLLVELQDKVEYLWATKFFDQSKRAKFRRMNRAAYNAALLVALKADPYAYDYSYEYNSDDEWNEKRALEYWPLVKKSEVDDSIWRRSTLKDWCQGIGPKKVYHD